MRESYYRRSFGKAVLDKVGGFVYHPADFAGIKHKQADLLWWPIAPVLIELKRWDRKKKPWTWKYEKHRNPEQTEFYKRQVKAGFQAFYVVYYTYNKRHLGNLPDRLYWVNERRFLSFKVLLRFLSRV
jgi:hypothetical protein